MDLWGEIYENETGVGVIGSVVEGRSDIGIGLRFLFIQSRKKGVNAAFCWCE